MEMDLGVPMDDKVSMSEQCAAAAKKDNSMLGCLNQDITSRDEAVVVPLCSVVVGPHLEYCVQLWSLLCRKCGQAEEGPQKGHRGDQKTG